ncbi:phage tail protein [Delftia acidovorans]|uniref:phage tail protein n=1 Tax=Delftia TaxID=80865 RepID=UPI000BC33DCC|nr:MULTISPECIES: tail fiber protein [Delftia]ATH12109.1 phage tail protein [Delftia acidovorans]MCB4784838.1 tail fiber protein [Delftia sp. Lp-1]
MEPFLGEIRAFAFGQVPRGWLLCNGAILPINTNQALFALLGTQYGGNGSTTFGLPDLRGRTPIGYGGSVVLGLIDGTENVTLTPSQMPQHTHQLLSSAAVATTNVPGGNVMAEAANGLSAYGAPTNSFMAATAVDISGGSQPHQNMQPSLVINWCIASSGIFPSRN